MDSQLPSIPLVALELVDGPIESDYTRIPSDALHEYIIEVRENVVISTRTSVKSRTGRPLKFTLQDDLIFFQRNFIRTRTHRRVRRLIVEVQPSHNLAVQFTGKRVPDRSKKLQDYHYMNESKL